MPSSYTTSLRLTLPATGELSGQWGNTINTGITELLDSAVAGTASISTWGGAGVAYTLSSTSGAADEARKMFIVASGSPGEAKNVICPAVSKFYVFRNDTTGGFALTLKTPSGTGISVPAGQYKFLYCDGTNVVEMFNSAGALSLSGNLTLSGGTANGVLYLNGSKVATSGSALTFDGTNLAIGAGLPTNLLTLLAVSTPGIDFLNGAGTKRGVISASSSALNFNSLTSNPITWQIDSSEKMRLDSSGNLGIGTSSLTARFESQKDSSATSPASDQAFPAWTSGAVLKNLSATNGAYSALSLLAANTAGTTQGYSLVSQSTSSGYASNLLFIARTAAGTGTVNATLDSSGNLGLGVTPSASWGGNNKAVQVGAGALFGQSTNTSLVHLSANYAAGSGDKYINSDYATDYYQYQGAHIWLTAPSGTAGNAITFTQAMTLDASGNLGVGTASPNAKLEVNGSIRGATGTSTLEATTAGDLTINASNAAGQIAFRTAGGERARITSGGDLLVGTTSTVAGAAFVVSKSVNDYLARFINSNATAYGVVVNYSGVSPNSTGQEFFRCVDSTADRMTVRSNGGIANYSANNVNLSDRREKTNFAPAKDYLDTICAIPVQTFNYIDQSPDDPGLTLGVVAQDVQAVAPELVMESNWGTKDDPKMRLSIYQTDLQYALMKCIQEQQALITALTARVAALEAQP